LLNLLDPVQEIGA